MWRYSRVGIKVPMFLVSRCHVVGEKMPCCWGKGGMFSSFAYTQTIVRLYANDRVPIPDLKRKKIYNTLVL